MKFVVLISLLLPSTSSVWAAAKHAAAGMVLKVDSRHKTILLSCEGIPGYMPAGVAKFTVKEDPFLARLAPGQLVDFAILDEGTLRYAEGITIREFNNLEQQPLAARRLTMVQELEAGASDPKELRVGERVPSAILIDQNRRQIDVAGFPGKVLVLNFFYTHCTLPDYCFRLSNNLGNVQKRFQTKMGHDLILLSLSFDPVHDQPEVLANYARTWHADRNWRFLTGTPLVVKNLCALFGVNSWPDEAELLHSLHTVILDRRGQMAANIEGNQFTAQQLGDLIEVILKR
jgi:protein SCO1/2